MSTARERPEMGSLVFSSKYEHLWEKVKDQLFFVYLTLFTPYCARKKSHDVGLDNVLGRAIYKHIG